MNQKEVIYLVGDFDPATLERWERWAEHTDQEIKRIPNTDKLIGTHNPVVIMDSHGLNDAPLSALERGTDIHEQMAKRLIIYDEVTSIDVQKMIEHLDKPMPLWVPRRRRSKGERKSGRATRW